MTLETYVPHYGYAGGPILAVRTELIPDPEVSRTRRHTARSHMMQAKDHAINAVRFLCAAQEALRQCAQNAQQAAGPGLNPAVTGPLMKDLADAAWHALRLLAPAQASFNGTTPAITAA